MNKELPTTNIGKLPEELKTLKDLELWFDDKRSKQILKAEAVKWVKEKFNLSHTIGCGFHADKGWLEFMEFFNITEEDLK